MSSGGEEPSVDRRVEAAIAEFWAAWPQLAPRLEAAGSQAAWEAASQLVTARVQAIHPALSWQMVGGRKAPFALCLCTRGDLELRILTERWLRAAPSDDRWELWPALPAQPGMPLEVGSVLVHPAELRAGFRVDRAHESVEVSLWHPRFGDLGPDRAADVAYRVLAAELGEDTVTRWIAECEAVEERPERPLPLDSLARAVEDLAAEATGEQFAAFQAENAEGQPLFFTVNQALKPIDHLLLDHHLTVELPLLRPGPEGLARPDELLAVVGLEETLRDDLGERAVQAARAVGAGCVRLHFFSSDDPEVTDAVLAWAAKNPARAVRWHLEPDPTWETLKRWL